MASLSNRKKYLWIIAGVVVLIVLLLIFKPKSQQTQATLDADQQDIVVRIAIPDLSSSNQGSSGSALVDHIYLNQLIEKTLAKDHIKVEWKFFKGAGPAINEALVNKQLDFAVLGDLAAIIGKANNVDTRLLAATGRYHHAYLGVLPNKGYHDLASLKGKRVAVWQGTAMQLSFDQFVESHGFTEKDFRVVNLDPAAANAALAAKQIDAAWGLITILALQQQGLIEIPLSTAQQNDGIGTIQSGLVARTAFIQAHPDVTQKIVNVFVQTAYWLSQPENRAAAINEVVNNAGYPLDLYKLNIKNTDFKDSFNPLLNSSYLHQFQLGVNTALKANLIKKKFDVESEWKNPEFVNRAVKDLKYENYWDH